MYVYSCTSRFSCFYAYIYIYIYIYIHVCVCVCARARARVCACACVCVYACVWQKLALKLEEAFVWFLVMYV